MSPNTKRLFFIDAMRAWAILMMLQGHFIDGLLDPIFKDDTSITYTIWKYFRGITAPVFFTVSGLIFTFLLLKNPIQGYNNPRIKKGIIRGLQLVGIGYLLRINFLGLLYGELYDAFFIVDVLQCIGLSLLGIVTVYLISKGKNKKLFGVILICIAVVLFLFEPIYELYSYDFLPLTIANYLTKVNGSVFTLIPWFGYAAFGGFIAILFHKFKDYKYFYPVAILSCLAIGGTLILGSSVFFLWLYDQTGIALFSSIYYNNYLFIRFGDVLAILAFFMLIRKFCSHKKIILLGQSTLSIYIIHFIILYGSFTGIGLYRFFNHALSPFVVISGAIVFMIACSLLAVYYEKHKAAIKRVISNFMSSVLQKIEPVLLIISKQLRVSFFKLLRKIGFSKN